MVDPISVAQLVLGGAQFAWNVGRAIHGSVNRSRGQRRQREQITRSYTRAQLYAPPPRPRVSSHHGPHISVYGEQRAYDTYEDEGTGIQMGTGFNRRRVMPPRVHWEDPFAPGGIGTVMAVDWTSGTAWAFVEIRDTYYLWYKVRDIDTDFFLRSRRYAVATVTLVDGCPEWADVPLELMDGFAYGSGLASTNEWRHLGFSSDLSQGDRVFVGMPRALLMGILVGRFANPTSINLDTIVDDQGNTFIHIDFGGPPPRGRRGPAHITVFRANTRRWAEELVWIG